jgi:MFS family permease
VESDIAGSGTDAETRRWRAAIGLVFALSGIGLSSWLSRLATVRGQLHLSVLVMGVLSLGLSVGSVAGFVVARRIMARLPARHAVLGALCVAGLGSALTALAVAGDAPVGVFAGLAVLGFGTGTCNVAMNVDAVVIERSVRRGIMPWFHAMFSLGGVLGAGAGAAATALHVAVSLHLLAVAAVTVTATVLVVRAIPDTDSPLRVQPDDSSPAATAPVRGGWQDRRTVLIGLLVLGMSFANGAANDWISLAMVTGHRVSPEIGALTFWVFVMATTVTRLLGTAVLQRFGRVGALRVSALCAAAGIGCFITAAVPGVAVVGAALWGFGSALGFPIGMSAAGDDPRAAVRNISVVATIGYAASLAGPPLLGLTGDHIGLLRALIAPLVTVVVAGLLAGIVHRPWPSRSVESELPAGDLGGTLGGAPVTGDRHGGRVRAVGADDEVGRLTRGEYAAVCPAQHTRGVPGGEPGGVDG